VTEASTEKKQQNPFTAEQSKLDRRLDPDFDAKARLAAARAARDRVALEREQAHEGEALERQVRAEEIALQNDIALQRAEQQHGREGVMVKRVLSERGQGCVIVKRATAAAFRRFQDAGELDYAICSALVRPCVVHPDLASFDVMMDEEPAMLMRITSAVCELAGARAEKVTAK
jgi:hypothetical protein